MARDLKYGNVVVERDSQRHPLNSTDEPVFIIRAGDIAAVDAIQQYFRSALAHGAGSEISGTEVIDSFLDWRDRNRDRVKVPD